MGSIVKGLFGGGKTKTTVENQVTSVPINYADPLSYSTRIGGRLGARVPRSGPIDVGKPRGLKDLRLVQKGNEKQTRRLKNTIGKLKSNQNDYINARVRPLEAALDTRVADQQREFARRGIFGSLSENEITKTRFLGEREIGDARALATDDALGQILNTEMQIRGLSQDQAQLTEVLLRDELARLGLSLEALQLSLSDQRQLNQVVNAGGTETTKEPKDILGGIGKIISLGSAVKGF